jgi:hypothetical protein
LSGAITAFSLQGKNKVFKLGLRIANAHWCCYGSIQYKKKLTPRRYQDLFHFNYWLIIIYQTIFKKKQHITYRTVDDLFNFRRI